MKINTKTILKDLEKNEIIFNGKPATTGRLIGSILTDRQVTAIDSLKAYLLALKFYENDEIEIDDADKNNIVKEIEEAGKDATKGFNVIVIGQLLKFFNDLDK